MQCKVADDPVVVMKSRPMKASNGVEGKTGMNLGEIRGGRRRPKAASGCEGVKPNGRSLESDSTKHWSTSSPTGLGTLGPETGEMESGRAVRSREYSLTTRIHCPNGIGGLAAMRNKPAMARSDRRKKTREQWD